MVLDKVRSSYYGQSLCQVRYELGSRIRASRHLFIITVTHYECGMVVDIQRRARAGVGQEGERTGLRWPVEGVDIALDGYASSSICALKGPKAPNVFRTGKLV
jgi:hypothetical protein